MNSAAVGDAQRPSSRAAVGGRVELVVMPHFTGDRHEMV